MGNVAKSGSKAKATKTTRQDSPAAVPVSKNYKLEMSLQENLITLMFHDDKLGKKVADTVDAKWFESEFRHFAEEGIKYWQTYNKPPGAHAADLFSKILDDPHNRKANTYKRILGYMLELSENINRDFVDDQLKTFLRQQQLKDAVLKAAEQYLLTPHAPVARFLPRPRVVPGRGG
jgi:hypothetical protein